VPPGSCVLVDGLTQAQIAALQYHGQLNLVRSTGEPETAATCRTLLVEPSGQSTLERRVRLTDWAYKATVRRITDKKESLLLYQRVGGS